MPVITVSRQYGSHGEQIAQPVTDCLMPMEQAAKAIIWEVRHLAEVSEI